MSKVAHIIGNGPSAGLYKPAKGLITCCNLPPFAVDNIFVSGIVDFKMFRAMEEGSVTVPGDWVLGVRPKKFLDNNPLYYMKHAKQIKTVYKVLPEYCANYTDFNCGHMVTHYMANVIDCDELHLYGFDSIFTFSLTSCTDFYLESDRSINNTNRLTTIWSGVWKGIFEEFSDKKFVLHTRSNNKRLVFPENVDVVLK